MQNENGKNLLPRGPKMLPGKASAGPVGRPVPAGGNKNVDRGFGRGQTAPGGIAKLPAPAGGKKMPGGTQGAVNRAAAKRAAIKRVMGPRG
jgi:hypothetical protein